VNKDFELVEVPEDLDDFNQWAEVNHWGDGLPLVPPTVARVEAMVAGCGLVCEHLVATLAPTNASATIGKIAANAVMAGCLPEYMPVVVAAVEALAAPELNLAAVQATTHPCASRTVAPAPGASPVPTSAIVPSTMRTSAARSPVASNTRPP